MKLGVKKQRIWSEVLKWYVYALVGWVVYSRLLRGLSVRTRADCEISEWTKNDTFARYKKQNNELKNTQKKSLKELRETELGDSSGFKNIKCSFKLQMLHFTTLFHKNVSLRQLKAILCRVDSWPLIYIAEICEIGKLAYFCCSSAITVPFEDMYLNMVVWRFSCALCCSAIVFDKSNLPPNSNMTRPNGLTASFG